MSDLLTTFFVALISMVIGYLISSVVRSLSNKDLEEKSPHASPPPSPLRKSDGGRNPIEVASFYREVTDGSVIAQIDGKLIQSHEGLTHEQRRRLVLLVTDLKPWLIGANRTELSDPQPGSTRLSGDAPINLPAPLIQSPAAAAAPKSMVTQIDEILQAQIAGTAIFHRGIRLTESPTHDVIVWIGPKSHKGIDQVPDPEIVTAIHLAVKTWENQQD